MTAHQPSPGGPHRANTLVGAPIERVEDLRFLRGRGCYLDDLVRPGQWHAAFVRSPTRMAGCAASMPTPRARWPECMLSSRAAISATRDPENPVPAPQPDHRSLCATGDCHIRWCAMSANPLPWCWPIRRRSPRMRRIAVELDIVAVAAGRRSRRRRLPHTRCCFPAPTGNCATTFTAQRGDVEAAFSDAPYRRRGAVPGAASSPRSRWRRAGCWPNGTRPRGGSPWRARPSCRSSTGARSPPCMGLPEQAVDYIEYDVGGGFGARGEFYPEDFLVAFAARKFGRPIKWVEDRREHFMTIAHAREAECDIEIALERDGTILGIRGDIYRRYRRLCAAERHHAGAQRRAIPRRSLSRASSAARRRTRW